MGGTGFFLMSLHVAVAEDDSDIQLVVHLALKKAGFTVSVVDNGEALLDLVAARRPDAILLDWMMPGMDGPTACDRLKADPTTAAIPIIFMTARSQESEIARGLALGAIGYIVKPFDALALGQQVRDLLGVT